MPDYSIAWWNVENLFDVSSSPRRSDKLERTLRGELAGWTQAVLNTKIKQLSSIIAQLNGGKGPDLLGVCEVENEHVLDLLVDGIGALGIERNYNVAHYEGDDGRGIDVAFIYDSDVFDFEQSFNHTILKRSATRELFQVNLFTKKGRRLMVIGNHWPSRSGGQWESEPYRMLAAETLSYFLSRIQQIHGRTANILCMGDFNDEPGDRSLQEYALSTRSQGKVVRAQNPALYNLMWPPYGAAIGTHYFNNFPNVLDQFMVTRGLARVTGEVRALPDSVKVERFPEMISGGAYPAPIRFGRPSSPSSYDQSGYSDHYPISMTIRESG